MKNLQLKNRLGMKLKKNFWKISEIFPKNIILKIRNRTNQKFSTIFQFQETVLIETVLIEDSL